MFTWICPQCGAEVPPAYSDCPNCKPPAPPPPRAAAPPPPPPVTPVGGPTVVSRPTPTAPPRPTAPPPPQPPQHEYAPAPPQPQYVYAPAPPRQTLSAWLVTLLVFGGLVGAGYAFYNYVLNKPAVAAMETPAPAPAESAESAAPTGSPRKRASLEKNLEVAGIRILEQNKRPQLRMMLINHSSADMAELAGTVTLSADDKAVATVPFSLGTLGAYEAKEISAPLKTALRAYELPDWQFIKAQVSLKN
ncbi:MAG: zinc ribbon domain-containing protein, partial [Acidobacteria bacterium]|nr:zinc ribbon domain-containing protein [Acidobacteriota bacterium]